MCTHLGRLAHLGLGVLVASLIFAPVAWAQELPPPPQEGPPPQQQGYPEQAPPQQQPYPQQQQPYPQQQQQPYPQQQPPPYQPPQQQYQPYQPYQPYQQPAYSPYGAQPGFSPYGRPYQLQPRLPPAPQPGTGTIVAGAIFLPLGVSLIVGSVFVWNYACNNGPFSCFSSVGGVYAAYGGVFMDIFGAAFTIMGLIFIPVGIVKQARYKKWRRSQGLSLLETDKVRLSTQVSGGLTGGTVGLRLEF